MSGRTLFISDLHLDCARPELLSLFEAFLSGPVAHARNLYILGDLFETWVGDDDPRYPRAIAALRAAADRGTTILLLRGNRDFLIGENFARASGCRLLPDPSMIELEGVSTLLTHGDTLCTDDRDYQQFRRAVRDPQWQAAFLNKPLSERLALADQLREESQLRQKQRSYRITDVTAQAVERLFQLSGARRMIHGHTHRPGMHEYYTGGKRRWRYVLGEWQGPASPVLALEEDGELRLEPVIP